MKNLPEQDFWNAIRNRLLQYKEEPDDDWDKIAGAIASTKSDYRGFSKASDVIVLVLFAFMLGFVAGDMNVGRSVAEKIAGKIVLPNSANDNNQSDNHQNNSEETKAETENGMSVIAEHPVTSSDNIVEQPSSGTAEKKRSDLMIAELENNTDTHSIGESAQKQAKAAQDEPVLQMVKDPVADSTQAILIRKDSLVEVRSVSSPALKENKKSKRKFRPSVYFTASPTLGFYKVIPIKDDQVEVKGLEQKGIFAGDRMGIQLEAGFQMAIKRNLELYASGSYYQSEQSITYRYTDRTQLSIASAGADLSYTLSPGEATSSVNLKQKNVGGGVGLMYHLHGRKLMHKIGGGLQFMQGLTRNSDSDGNLLPATRSLNYNLFYRMEYAVSPRTGIFLQPSFTRAFSANQNLNAPFNVRPYHAGLGFGVLFHF